MAVDSPASAIGRDALRVRFTRAAQGGGGGGTDVLAEGDNHQMVT